MSSLLKIIAKLIPFIINWLKEYQIIVIAIFIILAVIIGFYLSHRVNNKEEIKENI